VSNPNVIPNAQILYADDRVQMSNLHVVIDPALVRIYDAESNL